MSQMPASVSSEKDVFLHKANGQANYMEWPGTSM